LPGESLGIVWGDVKPFWDFTVDIERVICPDSSFLVPIAGDMLAKLKWEICLKD
jgi:hypothetical protein